MLFYLSGAQKADLLKYKGVKPEYPAPPVSAKHLKDNNPALNNGKIAHGLLLLREAGSYEIIQYVSDIKCWAKSKFKDALPPCIHSLVYQMTFSAVFNWSRMDISFFLKCNDQWSWQEQNWDALKEDVEPVLLWCQDMTGHQTRSCILCHFCVPEQIGILSNSSLQTCPVTTL